VILTYTYIHSFKGGKEEVKGYKGNTYRTSVVILFFIILFTSATGLHGCSQMLASKEHTEAKHSLNRKKETPGPSFLGTSILPIQNSEEEFYKGAGWLDGNSILYIANKDEKSSLHSYQLGTGRDSMLFKSDMPILTAELSPDRKYILIHRAVSNEGSITIIDTSGNELFSTNIESYELSFEWNPFKKNLILISAFSEEWDFNTYLLDIKEKKLEEFKLPEPFARWVSEDELAFQQWDPEGFALQAPLMAISLEDNKPKKVLSDVYQFDALEEYLFSVNVDETDSGKAQYTIYSKGFNTVANLNLPVLTSFSGWLVPFYALLDEGKDLIYLRPLHKGEADVYQDGFDLVRFNLDSEKEEIIFSGLANEPISCSPSGSMCLYGFQFEKLLNLKTKEIIELVHQGE
jgi:hypothetical protein